VVLLISGRCRSTLIGDFYTPAMEGMVPFLSMLLAKIYQETRGKQNLLGSKIALDVEGSEIDWCYGMATAFKHRPGEPQ
jgi:hypothetical protein